MSLFINPLLRTDSYKLSHKDQYIDGLEHVESNYTNRKSRIEGIEHVVQFGLQHYLKDLQEAYEIFFAADKDKVMDEYRQNTSTFVAPGFSITELEDLHDLGYLPIQFSAVPEGTLVPIGVPSILVKSTHKKFAWLVNYLESDLSANYWHPSTAATLSWNIRRVFDKAAKDTGADLAAVDWQGHDFSYRGQVNREAAMASGAAHLLSFTGSDVVPAVPWVNYYYPGDNGLIAASVPATEHSVMCAGGKEDEIETFRRLLKTYPEGILSIVSDTWDFWKVVTEYLPLLKDEIMARNGKLVIRPDSGDPADIICGTIGFSELARRSKIELETGEEYPTTPEEKGAISLLAEIFGSTPNESGYRELDPHIGLIYGDGMYKGRIEDINARLKDKGFVSTVWVAGLGSYFFQGNVTRDSFGSAVKATYVEVDGEGRDIFKDPATDDGTKKSAKGRLAVGNKADGTLFLIQGATDEEIARSVIQPVWENGKFLKEYSFAEVRANLKRTTGILERNGTLA
jgi:nicotinamide phosphoribosyltransferase